MIFRILLAGVLGGLLMFFAGAFEHMVLNFGDQAIHPLPDEASVMAVVRAQRLEHGIYSFPDDGNVTAENQEAAYQELNERYKEGPNGLLIVGRTGEDMMTGRELGLEFGSNVVACLLMAWVVSRFGPDRGFLARWLAVVLMGVAAWCSISASHAIWYRFHATFVRDELLAAALETALAGLVIAALVKPAASSVATASLKT
jgi:hypothetical protein